MREALALVAALALAAPALAAPGALVIAGGAIARDNAAVHRAFLDRARPGLIAIIPSASGYPADSVDAARATLVAHGADPARIVTVRLAAVDDPTTPGIDESRWAGNAADRDEVAKVARAGAIWFTGGDQLRTTAQLAPGGRATPMLKAIRARLAAGAVVGGTSAGAAVMSDPMIAGGEPIAALLDPIAPVRPPDGTVAEEPLALAPGLGFLTGGLVDQHFDARARLGRLARALFELPPARRVGYGVDEDTALVVDLESRTATVAGRGTVTILDATAARREPGPGFAASGLGLAIASAGDRIDLSTRAITPAPGRVPLPPATSPPMPDSGGIAVPPRRLEARLAEDIVSRPDVATRSYASFRGDRTVRFLIGRTARTAGWRGGDPPGLTLTGLTLAIRPDPAAPEETRP
ncbi:MAG: cyanophycinase [Sphingomonadaceae bacterium]